MRRVKVSTESCYKCIQEVWAKYGVTVGIYGVIRVVLDKRRKVKISYCLILAS